MVQVNVMIHYQLWQQQHQYNIIISLYKDESADDEHVQQCYLFIFYLYEELYIEVTTNHHKETFSSVTSRGAAVSRSFSSLMMQQVNFETSMKNIPLGGNKEYVE